MRIFRTVCGCMLLMCLSACQREGSSPAPVQPLPSPPPAPQPTTLSPPLCPAEWALLCHPHHNLELDFAAIGTRRQYLRSLHCVRGQAADLSAWPRPLHTADAAPWIYPWVCVQGWPVSLMKLMHLTGGGNLSRGQRIHAGPGEKASIQDSVYFYYRDYDPRAGDTLMPGYVLPPQPPEVVLMLSSDAAMGEVETYIGYACEGYIRAMRERAGLPPGTTMCVLPDAERQAQIRDRPFRIRVTVGGMREPLGKILHNPCEAEDSSYIQRN